VTENNHDSAGVKLLIAWAGTLMGGVTLSDIVLFATLIYTLLQIAILIRRLYKGQA
jgi:hypothetical protein